MGGSRSPGVCLRRMHLAWSFPHSFYFLAIMRKASSSNYRAPKTLLPLFRPKVMAGARLRVNLLNREPQWPFLPKRFLQYRVTVIKIY